MRMGMDIDIDMDIDMDMDNDNDEHIRLWCSMALFHEQCVFVSYMMSVGLLY